MSRATDAGTKKVSEMAGRTVPVPTLWLDGDEGTPAGVFQPRKLRSALQLPDDIDFRFGRPVVRCSLLLCRMGLASKMTYYCFTQDCEYYTKPAPNAYKGGYTLIGCGCGMCNGFVGGPGTCESCGAVRIELDNYNGVDERSEREKFAGTIDDWRREVVESNYIQSMYET